jgi:SAM-dependent methyltransferase
MIEQGFMTHGWDPRRGMRGVGDDLLHKMRAWDLFIEAVGDQSELTFAAGYAVALALPVIVVKQQGAGEIPVSVGVRTVLRYPQDASDQKGFDEFEADLTEAVAALKASTLAPGHRALRSTGNQLNGVIQGLLERYNEEHPRLHLMSGWTRQLSEEMDFGAHAPHRGTDPDYYLPMFSALQGWQGGGVQAIADLTEDIETFWRPEHPEMMSARVTERIFLIDWRLFFNEGSELTQYIERWRQHVESHRDRDYQIYIGVKDDRDSIRHPFGAHSVGQHLLLIEPDIVGGYILDDRGNIRLVIAEDRRERLLYGMADQFYNGIKGRAVRFDPAYGFLELKRKWLEQTRVGQWDDAWTSATEERSSHYFDWYDQHIRCWIPFYDQILIDCAASVESEIVRIVRSVPDRQLELLELGYGTGNLTELLAPWIETFNRPFEEPGENPPVRLYDGIDRAGRMRETAVARVRTDPKYLRLRLHNRTAWDDMSDDDVYDILFGSLVLHFLVGPNPTADALDQFFEACRMHVRQGGGLVFADAFGPDDLSQLDKITRKWHDWMTRNGLTDESAVAFLRGNQDMVRAASVDQFIEAGQRHGFALAKRRKYVGPFQIVVFRKTS